MVILSTTLILWHYSPISLAILTFSCLICYYAFKWIHNKAAAAITLIAILISTFLFFKLNFGVAYDLEANRIIPLGFSYYSFRMIHYAIERFKGTIPAHGVGDFIRYLFFLPTLLVGPINRFDTFIKDYKRLRFDANLIFIGLERMLFGYVKIIVLGNYLVTHKLGLYTLTIQHEQGWLYEYLEMIRFGANAYLQFSGYSDVAIGLALLFGFRVMENFHFPFLATNISDFWKRWHISLSSWCRDYVFNPFLALSRNSMIAAVATMIILAGWHEISLRYIVWGLMHASALSLWSIYDKKTRSFRLRSHFAFSKILGPIVTLHFVLLSFIVLREDSLWQAWHSIQKLLFLA